jgi:hypothetical protein
MPSCIPSGSSRHEGDAWFRKVTRNLLANTAAGFRELKKRATKTRGLEKVPSKKNRDGSCQDAIHPTGAFFKLQVESVRRVLKTEKPSWDLREVSPNPWRAFQDVTTNEVGWPRVSVNGWPHNATV